MGPWPPLSGPIAESISKNSRLGGILAILWRYSKGLILRTVSSSIPRMLLKKTNQLTSLHKMPRGPQPLKPHFPPSPERAGALITTKKFEISTALRLDYYLAGV